MQVPSSLYSLNLLPNSVLPILDVFMLALEIQVRMDVLKSEGIISLISEIISLSCCIVSYIFLLYIMASFIDLDIYIVIITLTLTLISGILIKNKKVIINLLLDLVSLGGIKLVYLIHDYITNEYYSVWMLLLLVFLMIFLFLYLSYTLLKNIKSIIIRNKYIRKGDNNENKKRS